MDHNRIPKPGEIYNHFKDKPYQIITVALHSETGEPMVVYQALYGDYKAYVRPLEMFVSEVDHEKYPEVKQTYRFELRKTQEEMVGCVSGIKTIETVKLQDTVKVQEPIKIQESSKIMQAGAETTDLGNSSEEILDSTPEGSVNLLLLKFLDAESFSKKLDVLTSNRKHLSDRLINDMAVALDCTVNEGPIDQRIQALVNSLQALCRFEDRRLR